MDPTDPQRAVFEQLFPELPLYADGQGRFLASQLPNARWHSIDFMTLL